MIEVNILPILHMSTELLIHFLFNFWSNFVYCGTELLELPIATVFDNLNVTDNFASATNSLKGLAGIYCIRCVVTGAMYIEPSTDLGKRMREHFFKSSNIHLRRALSYYGIGSFV